MDVHISQGLQMREAWSPCRRSIIGSRTLGAHAKVLSGHPAEGVHIPNKEGKLLRWGECFCALGLFIKGRQVASVFHAVPGAASAPLPSSLPAPASGGAEKAEQLLLGSASLPGSWAPVLILMSCSLGDLR